MFFLTVGCPRPLPVGGGTPAVLQGKRCLQTPLFLFVVVKYLDPGVTET